MKRRCIRKSDIIFSIGLVLVLSFFSWQNISVPTNSIKTDVKVVIDAGHGFPDGGAVGESGIKESELNLKVSKVVEKELLNAGIGVLMTRTDENAIYTNESTSMREKKRSDMRERKRIINESGARLAVSIHMNYFGIEKYSGPQLFYPSGEKQSEKAAAFVKSSIIDEIGKHCNREIKAVTGGIYLLENSDIPIVLAECGFLSNKNEEKLLCSDEYLEKMGKAIANGIISYLNSNKI